MAAFQKGDSQVLERLFWIVKVLHLSENLRKNLQRKVSKVNALREGRSKAGVRKNSTESLMKLTEKLRLP